MIRSNSGLVKNPSHSRMRNPSWKTMVTSSDWARILRYAAV
jgi:hypothetical protein